MIEKKAGEREYPDREVEVETLETGEETEEALIEVKEGDALARISDRTATTILYREILAPMPLVCRNKKSTK